MRKGSRLKRLVQYDPVVLSAFSSVFSRQSPTANHYTDRLRPVRYSKPQKLGDILRQVSAEIGLDSHLERGRVIAVWEDLMSPPMRAQVESSRLEKDRLFVHVSSAAWRHELHAQRKQWCERLNDELGRQAVREIVFR